MTLNLNETGCEDGWHWPTPCPMVNFSISSVERWILPSQRDKPADSALRQSFASLCVNPLEVCHE